MYTKEEISAIKANLHKIEDWCKENLAPNLRKMERVSVNFGELKHYPGSWKPEYEHSFTVEDTGKIYYRAGGLVLNFNDPLFPADNIYDSIVYAEDLLIYWSEVKSKLLQSIKEQQERKASILNFEV